MADKDEALNVDVEVDTLPFEPVEVRLPQPKLEHIRFPALALKYNSPVCSEIRPRIGQAPRTDALDGVHGEQECAVP